MKGWFIKTFLFLITALGGVSTPMFHEALSFPSEGSGGLFTLDFFDPFENNTNLIKNFTLTCFDIFILYRAFSGRSASWNIGVDTPPKAAKTVIKNKKLL